MTYNYALLEDVYETLEELHTPAPHIYIYVYIYECLHLDVNVETGRSMCILCLPAIQGLSGAKQKVFH